MGSHEESCYDCPADLPLPNYPDPATWLDIGVLLLLQGFLICALIRWRDPAPPQISILQGGS
jgi:hypothetical protein